MVADRQSRVTFLAADLLSAAQPSPTPPPKTRVGGFRRHASGRLSRRGRGRSMFTPGSRGRAYKSASGRGKWPNRDPKDELGFEVLRNGKANLRGNGANLYGFVFNDPMDRYDLLGLDCPGCDYLTAASPYISAAITIIYGINPGSLFGSPCALRACAQHDQCYSQNGCSMSSWGSTLVKLALAQSGIPVSYTPCEQCNLNVVGYMAACALSGGNYHSGDPQYFCANQKRFIKIPGDFPTLAAAKCACCTK